MSSNETKLQLSKQKVKAYNFKKNRVKINTFVEINILVVQVNSELIFYLFTLRMLI